MSLPCLIEVDIQMLLNHNKGINEEDYVTNLRSHAVSKPKSLPKTFLETTVAATTDS